MSLQHAQTRKAIVDAAVAYRNDPIEIANRKDQAERNAVNHYWNAILQWTNETNPKTGQAMQSSLVLPINQTISSGTLDAWETELTASGYYIERDGHQFKISIN